MEEKVIEEGDAATEVNFIMNYIFMVLVNLCIIIIYFSNIILYVLGDAK